jgi:hypothetical protein
MGSPAVAKKLGRMPVPESSLRHLSFIGPVYSMNGSYVPVHDDCPAAFERRIGHQAQTLALGLELSAHTEQLVFGPAIGARHHIARGELVEISVLGWDVRSPLFVACNVDRVLASVYQAIVSSLKDSLRRMPGV